MPKLFLFLPVVIFAILAGLFALGLSVDPNTLRSPFLGKPLPPFSLASLEDSEVLLTEKDLRGPAIVNLWASWCTACREEHAFLLELAHTQGVTIYGIDHLDQSAAAQAWLKELGNPYAQVLFDAGGQLGNALGTLGTPESYLIDQNGRVRFRHVGAMTEAVWQAMRETLASPGETSASPRR